MIVRSWHRIVPLHNAEAFRKYLLITGVREAKAIPGNLAAYIHSQAKLKRI